MNEPRVIESVTNECQLLGRAHESSSARAEQLIACLEGEIAKRDARIVELKDQAFKRDGRARERDTEILGLRAELASTKAQEPVAFAFRYDDGSWHDVSATQHSAGMVSLYAAPVSEAKAQGVTDEQAAFEAAVAAVNERGWSTSTDLARQIWDAARLNTAPVQQASVPDGWRELLCEIEQFFEGAGVSPGPDIELRMAALLAAAPAAPAADAGLVDEHAEFESWIVEDAGAHAVKRWPNENGPAYENDRVQDYRTGWVECIRRMALAAHRVQGVV